MCFDARRYDSISSQMAGIIFLSWNSTRNSKMSTLAFALVTLMTFAPRKYPLGTMVGLVSFASSVV